MNALTIANTGIRQDAEGRYFLNDLHRASGGEQRLRPKYWLENQQAQELIGELEIGGIPPINAKQGLGTFAVKELVYAYAMWISPAFHIHVIRAFDASVQAERIGHDTTRRPRPSAAEPYREAAEITSSVMQLGVLFGTGIEMTRAIAADQVKKVTGVDCAQFLIGNSVSEVPMNPTKVAAELGLKDGKAANLLLEAAGLQKRAGKSWVPTEAGRKHCTLNPYKAANSEHSGYRILWHRSVLTVLQAQSNSNAA